MNTQLIPQTALRTIDLEIQALQGLREFVTSDFEAAVSLIHQSKGRLIISGIGKSALIAQKIVATLNSTGTPSLYMHATDAIHGDLGMVQPQDIVLIISKSGNSAEIKVLCQLIKNFGNKLIGMVGNVDSFLAKQADFVINTTVQEEACPHNLAPTSSTTAQLVMGDTLAICLMELTGFTGKDFAKIHPGGILGKKLYLRAKDLFHPQESPKVYAHNTLKEVIVEITKTRLGATAVIDESNNLLGIITDGDLRRMLEKNIALNSVTAIDIMTPNPKTISPDELAIEAMEKMRTYGITQLVVCENNKYLGIIHLHELLKEGLI